MKVIAKIFIFLSTFTAMSKDLLWGEWLSKQKTILNSPDIPIYLNKYIPFIAMSVFIISFVIDTHLSHQTKGKLISSIRKKFLDRLHKDTFQSSSPNKDDFNRITFFTVKPWWCLFRRDGLELRFYIPWYSYLIVTSRTGKFQSSLTSFRINGDKEVKNNGVAGLSWHDPSEIIKVPRLNPEKKDEYCTKSNLLERDFNKLNQKSKYYSAFCVRDSNEKKIGVIVFDTINAHTIQPEEFYSAAKSFSTIHED